MDNSKDGIGSLSHLKPGDKHYKAYVGPIERYDLIGAVQFNLLTSFGLREEHRLLDIGCGSLRAGKLLIPYLLKERYFGVEPNKWLIEEGIKNELGGGILEVKSPSFYENDSFDLEYFEVKFDFILAQSIFSHTSKSQIQKCFAQVKSVLSDSGIFLATFVLGRKDYEGEDWVYPGIVEYSKKYIHSELESNELVGTWVEGYHPKQRWIAISHLRNKKKINVLRKKLEKGQSFHF